MKCIVSCEHASNRLPSRYAALFQGKEKVLASHQSYDPGAAALARRLAKKFNASLHLGSISRLLIDLNRSPTNRKTLFSSYSGMLEPEERRRLQEKYYNPYRERLEKEIAFIIRKGRPVLHISVHSFVPVKGGKTRRADVSLLYDPARKYEKKMCGFLAEFLKEREPRLKIRRNYPYLGKTDGFTSFLRKQYSAKQYAGIEIEINQALLLKDDKKKRRAEQTLVEGIMEVLKTQDFSRLKN